jgi:hypothetical protein
MTSVDGSELPRLGIFYDDSSAPIFELVQAAQGLCRVVWLVGWSSDEPSVRLLSRFGEVVDLSEQDESEFVEMIVARALDGVVAFSDAPLRIAAEVARRLNVPFHSPSTARLLTDKLAQREAFRDAGLSVPIFAPVRSSSYDVDVPFPAILKPRSGSGSRDTFRVEGSEQLATALSKCTPNKEFILEELLTDRSLSMGHSANIVSVESIVHDGDIQHVMVTGRLPFAPPFRESGSFLPSDLPPADWEAVTLLASEAARALAITCGILHTEIKMTSDGPRLVEVNGRLGGGISALVSRIGGPSLTSWAMELALGRNVGRFPILSDSSVAFFRLVVAPAFATNISSLHGVTALKGLLGIDSVESRLKPGDTVDTQKGFTGYVLRIDGTVGSHAELFELLDEIDATLTLTWSFD